MAAVLQVSPKPITRWAQRGRLRYQRILGDHRRSPATAVEQLAASLVQEVRAT